MPSLKFSIEGPTTFIRDVPGTDVKISITREGGEFRARHRNQPIGAPTIDRVLGHARDIEESHQAKAQRAKDRRANHAEPRPALLRGKDGGLSPVHVRGIDRRSGQALITLPSGDKAPVPQDRLVQILSSGDAIAHAALQAAYVKANEDLRRLQPQDCYDLLRELAQTSPPITVTYDPVVDKFVAVVDWVEFTDDTSLAVCSAVERHVVISRLPWRIEETGDGYVVKPNDRTQGKAYPTRELADRAAEVSTRRAAAWKELTGWLAARSFDLSWAQ